MVRFQPPLHIRCEAKNARFPARRRTHEPNVIDIILGKITGHSLITHSVFGDRTHQERTPVL
jgi:hypothetical protein